MAKAWADFYNVVLPDVAAAPLPLVDDTIRRTAIDFCAQSFVYQVDHLPVDVEAEVGEYDFSPGADLVVVRVERAWFEKQRIHPKARDDLDGMYAYWPDLTGTPQYFLQEKVDKIILVPAPAADSEGALLMKVAVKPSLAATGIDDALFEEYRDAIAHGAKGLLFAMPQKPWTNPDQSTYHMALFQDDIARARLAAAKGRTRARLRTKATFF